MNINTSAIKNYLDTSYQFAGEKLGKLGNWTVRELSRCLRTIQTDPRAAAATMVVGSILFVEIAVRVTELMDSLMDSLIDKYASPRVNDIWFNRGLGAATIIGLFSSLCIGMNIALYKGLQLPLNRWMAAAIATASSVAYVFIREVMQD